jgi:hypothetical protein
MLCERIAGAGISDMKIDGDCVHGDSATGARLA